MNKNNIEPKQDGVTHINVYSKARTPFGKMLSNFEHCSIDTPDGKFASVEGYWSWMSVVDCPEREQLRRLYGFQAKKIGKELVESKGRRFDDDFEHKILVAIEDKFRKNIKLMKPEYETLPILHYYTYGNDDKYVVVDVTAKYQWMINGIEEIRRKLVSEHKGD